LVVVSSSAERKVVIHYDLSLSFPETFATLLSADFLLHRIYRKKVLFQGSSRMTQIAFFRVGKPKGR